MDRDYVKTCIYFKFTMAVLVVIYFISIAKLIILKTNVTACIFLIYLIIFNLISFYKSSMYNPGSIVAPIKNSLNSDELILLSPKDITPSCTSHRIEVASSACNEEKKENLNTEILKLNANLVPNVKVIPNPLENSRLILFFDENKVFLEKFCDTCCIFRPVGTSHCNECGSCILERNHHCFWLDNCIGRNNIKNFYGFIISLSILSLNATFSINCLRKHFSCSFFVWIPIMFILCTFVILISGFTLFYIFLAIFGLNIKVFRQIKLSQLPQINIKTCLRRLLNDRPDISASSTL